MYKSPKENITYEFILTFLQPSMFCLFNIKSWRQHNTKHQLYGHLLPIRKTIQVRWTRHAGHCWRSRDDLISDVLLWTPTYGRAKAGRIARTYIQQLFKDTGCSSEALPEAMNEREKWRKRVRDIRASGTTWWWWWCLVYLTSIVCCIVTTIELYVYIYKYMRNIIKHNDELQWTNEHTSS